MRLPGLSVPNLSKSRRVGTPPLLTAGTGINHGAVYEITRAIQAVCSDPRSGVDEKRDQAGKYSTFNPANATDATRRTAIAVKSRPLRDRSLREVRRAVR